MYSENKLDKKKNYKKVKGYCSRLINLGFMRDKIN